MTSLLAAPNLGHFQLKAHKSSNFSEMLLRDQNSKGIADIIAVCTGAVTATCSTLHTNSK